MAEASADWLSHCDVRLHLPDGLARQLCLPCLPPERAMLVRALGGGWLLSRSGYVGLHIIVLLI